MVFVILQIRCAARVLKPWYGCVVPNGSSVADVYTDYSSGTLDHGEPVPEEYRNSSIIARIGKNRVDLTQVSSSCQVGEAVSALGQYIEFAVSQSESADASMMQEAFPRADAFALMQSSRLSNALPRRWLRFQFWPRRASFATSRSYTGRLKSSS